MKKITTVRGDISPDELGVTSMHEHTLSDLRLLLAPKIGIKAMLPPERMTFKLENFSFLRQGLWLFSEGNSPDTDFILSELNAFKKVGGRSIVDGSPIGLRGDPVDLLKVSEASGVNIICATGLYTAVSQPEAFIGKSEAYMSSCFKREIHDGIDGTNIKPGFLKCAINERNDNGTIDDRELTAVRACAKIAAENGMSLQLHSAYPVNTDHILQTVDIILNECGVQPEKLLLLHMDTYLTDPKGIMAYISDIDATKNLDTNTKLLLQFLDKGINISFDSWGNPMDNPSYRLVDDYDKIKALVYLLKRGYGSQIVLGQDALGKFCGVSFGNYGYTRIVEFVPKMLAMVGLSEESNKMLEQNPERILSY